MADVVGQVPGQLPTFTSGHNPQAGVPGGGTVTSISGVSPIATVPDPIVGAGTVQFPSWPADAPGELTNDGAGVLSWETDVGNFVRLLADPTIDQDVGGFHVTLSGLSDTAFLVNTLTNPGDAKFRALGTTDDFIELEYTTAAANSYSGLRLQGPAARTLEINLFGSGTSGVAHGWDGTVYDLPAGSALYGAGVDAHWFKLSGSTDYTGSFQLYDNGANFFPALSLVSIDGGAAVGAVTVGANPRINAIPPDFSVFHGATTATGLGTERIRITDELSDGTKFVFGNVPAFATMSGNPLRDFQFVGNIEATNLLLSSNGPGTSQFSLYSLDTGGNGDGIHLIAYAQDTVEPSEYAAFVVGGLERWQIPFAAGTSDNTEFILEANYAGGLDGQLCLYSARVGNTATTDTRVTFGAESQAGADADFVLYTGGTESLRISGATKKVTMPGVLDPPEIDVINKVPGDMAVAPIFFAATDSGANTSNVSLGIELPNSVGVPGDLVLRAGGAGVNTGGTDWMRMSGVTGAVVFSGTGTPAHVAIGSGVSVNATINLTAVLAGVVGNVYTVEIVAGVGLDVALGVVEAGTVTTITLGTDGAGDPDPTKNTATLVLAELGASTLFTGALAGDGSGVLVPESQLFFGGAEAITASAGGASFANSTPSDTAEVAAYWSATDSGANTFRVRTGIELTTHPEVAPDPMGDWVLRTFAPGDPPEGIERLRVLGNGSYMVLGTATLISGSGDLVLEAAEQGNVTLRSDTLGDVSSQTELTINGTFSEVDLTFIGAGAGGLYISPTFFEPQDDDLQLLGNSNHQWNTIYGGTGRIASSHIGSGADGTVNLVADDPGIAGNEFTATVAAGVGLNVPMTAAFTLQALLVTLGTDGAGALDPAKNTATLIAGAINTAAGGVTATASGTGADPLTGAEGPTTFTGGAESLTLAGGLSANANIYLTNLPGSDPGIPGALYHTAGAVMVSL